MLALSSKYSLTAVQKPDPAATKELCIVALTDIYSMAHQYQTLVREITTPTLPTYVTSCLNLLSSKSSKVLDVPSSLAEAVFRSFATLLPRHTTIYRPFVSKIRLVTRPYLAPTISDGVYIPSSLKESARRLVIVLHQAVAKNASGEEWGKAVRDLVKETHATADQVFRAVIEDWESTAGYVGSTVDVNRELSGGARTTEDLPRWTGIDAGVERLIGLIAMLEEYFKLETSTPVSIPLGAIMDMLTRMLSIAVPASLESASAHSGARLHPAIDRDERDGLWSGMPQIYVAAVLLISTVAERLQDGFLSIAQGTFDQLVWVFPFGRHSPEFRLVTYHLIAKVLFHIGQSFTKSQCSKLSSIIRSCCKDLQPIDPNFYNSGSAEINSRKGLGNSNSSNQNADAFLQSGRGVSTQLSLVDTDLTDASRRLLPFFLSHVPQRHLDISLRSLVERTAILTHDKDAMLTSILNPFVGKNGKAMTSILPYLTRKFPHDAIVEILLRPRMPLLPSTVTRFATNDASNSESEDEDMEFHPEPLKPTELETQVNSTLHPSTLSANLGPDHAKLQAQIPNTQPGLGAAPQASPLQQSSTDKLSFGTLPDQNQTTPILDTFLASATDHVIHEQASESAHADVKMRDETDSDDESVHLTMQLDTDSEEEG
jgi:pre-rRNA-processing protein RIX1